MFLIKIRDFLMKRPLCLALAGFLIVYFTFGFLRGDFKIILSVLLFALIALSALFAVSSKRRISLRHLFPILLIIFALCFASLFSWIHFDIRLNEISDKYHEKEVDAEVTVIKVNSMSDFYSSHDIMIREIDGDPCRVKAKLTSSYYNTYREGDTLRLKLTLSAESEYSNLSEAYDLSHGFLLYADSADEENIVHTDSEDVFPYTYIYPIQKAISLIIERFTEGNGSALSRALIYGDRGDLPYSFTSSFKELGISHMLAISGMHFSVVVGLFAILLSKLRIPKQFSLVLLTLFVIFYAMLAGFSASVCRAAFMLLFSYASFIFGRRSDSLTALFIAVFLICILTPYAIYDIGMLLSFLSTLGILSVALPINEKLRQNKLTKIRPIFSVLSAVNITLSAVLFTLPITHFCFGYISYVSPLSNLLFIPLITVLMYLFPFLVIFSRAKYIAGIIGYLITFISDITVRFSEHFAASGDYCIDLDYFFCTILLALMFIAIAAITVFIKSFKDHIELIFIPMIVFVMGCYIGNYFVMLPYERGMSIMYYTEDENDAVIVISDGEALLCDSSDGSYSFLKNALEYARDVGKVEVTSYMITDYHYTHIGTVTKLAKYSDIRSFILPISLGRDKNYHYSVTRYLRSSGYDVSLYRPGENSIIFNSFLINSYIYEHSTANPASVVFFEDTEQNTDSYMYISNIRDMCSVNEDFEKFITESAKMSSYIICGSHGSSDEAMEIIEEYIPYEPLYDSFYSKIK